MSEYFSMVNMMGRIGELLGVVGWQFKGCQGGIAVGVVEHVPSEEFAPVVATKMLNGGVMEKSVENKLFQEILEVAFEYDQDRIYDATKHPTLCLSIKSGERAIGAILITTCFSKRNPDLNEAVAIANIIRWIEENVETDEDARVRWIYGRFGGGQVVHDAIPQ